MVHDLRKERQMSVTPMQVEARLRELGAELDEAHKGLVAAEEQYFRAKADYEIGVAAARLRVGQRFADKGTKGTVQEREDLALIETTDLLKAWYSSEAVVRAARANSRRVQVQIEIARSVGTSVRSSMEIA
jgi:hypothetical protein